MKKHLVNVGTIGHIDHGKPTIHHAISTLLKEPKMNSELIARAEAYAAKYDDDERPDVKTDVLNAYYAGAALSTEAQPEVTGAVAWVHHFTYEEGEPEAVLSHSKEIPAILGCEYTGKTVPLYPPSAIEAAVREKLEEAARICEVRSRGINCQQSLRDCAKRIRALMESPNTSVEEPAN